MSDNCMLTPFLAGNKGLIYEDILLFLVAHLSEWSTGFEKTRLNFYIKLIIFLNIAQNI